MILFIFDLGNINMIKQLLNSESVQSMSIFTDTKTYSKKVTDTVSNKNESGKKITSQKESPEVPEKPK